MHSDNHPAEPAATDPAGATVEQLTRRVRELEQIERTAARQAAGLQHKLADATRLLRASTAGLITLDKAGIINGINPRAADMLGADSAYLIKKPFSLFIAPEDQAVFFINRSRVVAGSLTDPFDIALKRKDGTPWSARIQAQPVTAPGQHLPGLILAIEDISRYRRVVEDLQVKEYLLDMCFGAVDDLAAWSTADIDEIISLTLEKIGLMSGADRVYVALFHTGGQRLSVCHEWLADEIQSPASALQAAGAADFVGLIDRLKHRRTVAVEDVARLPEGAGLAHRDFHAPGLQSLLYTPLFYGRFLLGVIGCDAVRQPVAWTKDSQRLLTVVGGAILQALLRRRIEQLPGTARESLLQLVASDDDVGDVPLEYDGPIDIIDDTTAAAAGEKSGWRIEAGDTDDPALLRTGVIKDGQTVTIACTNCSRQKLVGLETIRTIGARLKATCSCGHTMYIRVELRREHRKAVRLDGIFMRGVGDRIAPKSDDWGRIHVTNLSRHGVGFTLFGKPDIRVKDRLRIKFTLDNTAETVIQKAVVVRSVAGDTIGGEFTDKDPCDVTLGFYMMT